MAGGFTPAYLLKQLFFLGWGFVIIVVMVNYIPVKIYSAFATWMVYISISLLVLTILLKFAHIIKGSGRTLFFFQPAEFAKISLICYTAKILGQKNETKKDFQNAFKKIIKFTIIICGLIFLSNFSASALLLITIMSMMFIGRIPLKYLILVIISGAAIVIIFYKTADYLPESFGRVHTLKGRLERFIYGDPNSEKGITQAEYAKLAIYEGGLFGKGIGQSDVRNYMAEAYSDFIFAIIIEEYGLFFGAGVIFLYLVFFFRSGIIVRRTNRTFPAFLVAGLTLILVYQAMMNMGVSSGVLPVTGQPLPWISMGGTALLFTAVCFGGILSVSYQNQLNQEVARQPIKVNTPDEDFEMGK